MKPPGRPSTGPCMPGRSFRIARIAGIPVGISPLWLIIVALITWTPTSIRSAC
jgi:hypothetical protein